MTWTGECSGGLAQGIGRTVWYQNDEVSQTVGTRLRDGRNDGWTVVRDFGDDAGELERCYVNDEPRGRGIDRFSGNLSSGNTRIGPFRSRQASASWPTWNRKKSIPTSWWLAMTEP